MSMRGASRRPAYDEWPLDDAGEAATVTPQHLAAFLKGRGWIVAAVTALCLIGGVVFQLTSTPRYVSTAQIILDPRELQNVAADATPRNDTADATSSMIENEMRVLKSNVLLGRLIDAEDLRHDPEFVANPAAEDIGLRGLLGEKTEAPIDAGEERVAVLNKLDRMIAVQRTERSYVIDITVTTSNPEKSARIANTLVRLYIAQANQTRADVNGRVADSLKDRLSALEGDVRAADNKVETFREANGLVSVGGILTSDQNLRDLNTQLVTAQARADEDKARSDQLRRLRAEDDMAASPEAVQSMGVLQIRAQIADAIRRRAALARDLGPRHPEYIASDNQVRQLQGLLQTELRRVAEAAGNQAGRSRQSAATLQRNVDALSRDSLKTSRALVRLRELERDAEASRSLFNAFLARSRELSEQTRLDTTNVRQIGVAMPALRKANLPNAVVLSVSGVLGLLFGTLLALALGFRQHMRGETPARHRA